MHEETSLKNLWMLRKNAGLSQQALGERFNLSQQTIYKYENGLAEPDIDTLIRFAAYFNVSVDFLIGNTKGEAISEESVPLDYTVEEKDFVLMIRKLNPDVRHALTAFLNNMTKNDVSGKK